MYNRVDGILSSGVFRFYAQLKLCVRDLRAVRRIRVLAAPTRGILALKIYTSVRLSDGNVCGDIRRSIRVDTWPGDKDGNKGRDVAVNIRSAVEFDIPAAATAGGELILTWTAEAGRGGTGRGCQVAEVFLMKKR